MATKWQTWLTKSSLCCCQCKCTLMCIYACARVCVLICQAVSLAQWIAFLTGCNITVWVYSCGETLQSVFFSSFFRLDTKAACPSHFWGHNNWAVTERGEGEQAPAIRSVKSHCNAAENFVFSPDRDSSGFLKKVCLDGFGVEECHIYTPKMFLEVFLV